MKTNNLWRRMLIGISFVLAMALVLAGCGKSGPAEADYIGYWEVSGGTLYGEEYDAEMLQMMKDWGMVMVIHLDKDGKAEMDLFGEVIDGTWDLKDKRMTFEGDTLEFKLENDTLYIVEGDDNLTFTRGNSTDLAAAIETDRNSASTGGFGTEDPAGGTYEPVTIPVDPPIVVANDDVVTASIIEKATESTGETGYVITVTNNSSVNVTFYTSTGYTTVDGVLTQPWYNAHLAPGESSTDFMYFEGITSLDDLKNVELHLFAYNSDTYDSLGEYVTTID